MAALPSAPPITADTAGAADYVLMRYYNTGAVAIRRKGAGQILQICGVGDLQEHEAIADKIMKELRAGCSEADAKELMKVLKAESLTRK